MGKAYYYYLGKSIVKNILLLPAETAVMYVVFRTMTPLLARMRLVAPQGKGIPFIAGRKRA